MSEARHTFETLGHYHDHLVYVETCAPDFPVETWEPPSMTQRDRLDEAFELLRAGAHLAEKKLKDARRAGVFRELVTMSFEAFVAGDCTLGRQALQEAEGMVWIKQARRPKHVVEAERRAFGDVVIFRDVVISPYPYEGTEADLGDVQRQLWRHAAAEVERLGSSDEPLFQHWVMARDGTIRVAAGRSRKAIQHAIRGGAADGSLKGAALADQMTGGGLLAIHVEEAGKPAVSIVRLTQNGVVGEWRFHLNDP